MVQVYFLVVLSNIIMGIILAKEFLNKKIEGFAQIDQIISSEIFQVTVGSIGSIVGILALFLRYTGNMIILGDIFPALTAIISGITLFIEYIINEESENSSIIEFFKKIFLKNKVILGFISFIAGVLHFIAPSVELL